MPAHAATPRVALCHVGMFSSGSKSARCLSRAFAAVRSPARRCDRRLGRRICSTAADVSINTNDLPSKKTDKASEVFEVCAAPGVVPEPSRLDAYLTVKVPEVSRGRIVASIKGGLVVVNGVHVKKPSHKISAGDRIVCEIPSPPPLEASPEDIPLEIHYEDDHLMIVNKPAGMVVHPSAGHESGTLVNAVLFHCRLPPMRVLSGHQSNPSAHEEKDDDEASSSKIYTQANISNHMLEFPSTFPDAIIRPGIVHRLDKGTTGLMVVAKDPFTHAGLCEQFAARTVRRRYLAIVIGIPNPLSGRVNAPIGRDPMDRLRMGVVRGVGGRQAASNYTVRTSLAQGNAALVEWQLETGRTHQIRVHTKDIGHSILGDDTYGGGGRSAVERLHRRGAMNFEQAKKVLQKCNRPMLHARTLGFQHPVTGEELDFAVDPPSDFAAIFQLLNDV
jgi:23S rRNA pseudouridine1911/1915/1917 synthase